MVFPVRRRIVAQLGRLDALVNTVGGYTGGVKLWEAEAKVFDQMLALNLRAGYALAEEVERAGGANADAEAQQLFEQILERRPDNLAALLERARLAAKRNDLTALRDTAAKLDAMSAGWPPQALEQHRALRAAVSQLSEFREHATNSGDGFWRDSEPRLRRLRAEMSALCVRLAR